MKKLITNFTLIIMILVLSYPATAGLIDVTFAEGRPITPPFGPSDGVSLVNEGWSLSTDLSIRTHTHQAYNNSSDQTWADVRYTFMGCWLYFTGGSGFTAMTWDNDNSRFHAEDSAGATWYVKNTNASGTVLLGDVSDIQLSWGDGTTFPEETRLSTDEMSYINVTASLPPGATSSPAVDTIYEIWRSDGGSVDLWGFNAGVGYIAAPEPMTIGILGFGALSFTRRKRKA